MTLNILKIRRQNLQNCTFKINREDLPKCSLSMKVNEWEYLKLWNLLLLEVLC